MTKTLDFIEYGTHELANPLNSVILDFESTGLGHDENFHPLELAAQILNPDFEVIATFSSKLFAVEQEILDSMNEYVRNMHETTGLYGRLTDPHQPRFTAAEIDRMFAGTIAQYFPKRGEILEDGTKFRGITVGGNSVSGVDIPALRMFMPLSYDMMDYTPLDVSSIRQFLLRTNPQALANMPAKLSDHTALTDVNECIRELVYYRGLLSREQQPA